MLSQCVNIFEFCRKYLLIFNTCSKKFSFLLGIDSLVINDSNFIEIINASHADIRWWILILILILFFILMIFCWCFVSFFIIVLKSIIFVIFSLEFFNQIRDFILSYYQSIWWLQWLCFFVIWDINN